MLPASCQSCVQGKILLLFKYNCFGPDPVHSQIGESRYEPSQRKTVLLLFFFLFFLKLG